MIAWAQDAERAAIIGGGLLGLEAARGLAEPAGSTCDVVHRSRHLMNLQLDASRRRILHRAHERRWASACTWTADDARGRQRARHRPRFADGSELECDMVVVVGRRPAQRRARRAVRPAGGARDRGRRRDARRRRGRHLRRRRVRAAPRPALRARRAAVGAGDGPRRASLRPQPAGRLPRLQARHQAEGLRRRAGHDGPGRARASRRRGRPLLRAARAASTSR